jgi:hypothetical protein
MSKYQLVKYTQELTNAAQLTDPYKRERKVSGVLQAIRQDKSIPALTLCAWLQDNARIIKEVTQ